MTRTARVKIENSGFLPGASGVGWKSPRTMGNFRNWQTKNNMQHPVETLNSGYLKKYDAVANLATYR